LPRSFRIEHRRGGIWDALWQIQLEFLPVSLLHDDYRATLVFGDSSNLSKGGFAAP
jgi:hypothetical protein